MIRNWILLSMLLVTFTIKAQNTVGIVFQEQKSVYDGYNLIFPHNQSNVFLLDNCGQIVHTWEDDEGFRPGNAVYLLENGNLVKCKRAVSSGPANSIWAGGGGETVEVRTWDNELVNSFTLNDNKRRLHHDIAVLPNGNILMIAWENKDSLTSIAAGRDTALMSQGKVWTEIVLEWNPEEDRIVWEWNVWDHLIQNYDATKANYGNPNEHPELINLNYDESNGHPDWLHINAIAYNPVLDQIALSVPEFNEFWIIDHSTTTSEAASHEGGNSGKGGDLLYRWGNPITYGGAEEDKKLFFQHDVQWINPNAQQGDEDFGKISLYNNRLPNFTSTANIIATLTDGEYQMEEGQYLPTAFERTVIHPQNDKRAFSTGLSSAQFLPNGNTLILAGRWGFAYEISPENEVVWNYVIPLKGGKAVNQGDTLGINNNITFRMTRYGLDYEAFQGKDLTPKGYWELNPNEGFCGVVSVDNVLIDNELTVFPNPANTAFTLELEKGGMIEIYNGIGKVIKQLYLTKGQHELSVQTWQKGIYFITSEYGATYKLLVN